MCFCTQKHVYWVLRCYRCRLRGSLSSLRVYSQALSSVFFFDSAKTQSSANIAEFRSRSAAEDYSVTTANYERNSLRNGNIYYRDQKITQIGDPQSYGISEYKQPSVENDATQDYRNYNGNNQQPREYQERNSNSEKGSQIQSQTQFQSSSGNSGSYQIQLQAQSQSQTYNTNQNKVASSNSYTNNIRSPPAYVAPAQTPRPAYEPLVTSNKDGISDNRNQQDYQTTSDQQDMREQQSRPNQMELYHVRDEQPFLQPNEKVSVVIEYPTERFSSNDESKII